MVPEYVQTLGMTPLLIVPLPKGNYLLEMRAEGGRPASLFRFNFDSMSIEDRFELPENAWMSSLQFVPKKGGSGGDTDGYVITAVSTDRGSEIWVFDGANLAQGPLCRLGHPKLQMGVTIHSAWLPEIGARRATYKVPAREDFGPIVDKSILPSIKKLFEEEIYPRFP